MTKFQKQMLTIAAAGALTAVTALPAMAFENEFHGLFNFNAVFSNYNTGASADFSPTSLKDSNKMNNYFENRTRLQYTAKASDDLKLVTHFEINNRWGRASNVTDTVTGKSIDAGGNDLDTDGLNIVTKHAYLDFNIGKSFNTKVGLLPYKDSIKGVFIDADVPALYTTTKLGAYTLGLGYSRISDRFDSGGTTVLGNLTKDLFIMDNSYALNKDTKLGFSYYLLSDGTTAVADPTTVPTATAAKNDAFYLHTLGLSGETKLGALELSGFAAMQAGYSRAAVGTATAGSYTHYHGWAAAATAKMGVGIGQARTGLLFLSGDNTTGSGNNHAWTSSGVGSFNDSGLMILTRNTANSPTSTDQYIRRVLTNQAVAYLGYDAKLTDKFNLDSTVGFAWVPASKGAPNNNGSDFLGTEISTTAGYQLYKNLKLMAQAGYMINGGYYKDSITKTNGAVGTPENPYTMRLQARYSF